MRDWYLRQDEGYDRVRSTSYPGSGTTLNSMGNTHQIYVVPSEANGEKAVSGPVYACAVRVRVLDGELQVRARSGPALGFRGHVDDQVVVCGFVRKTAPIMHAIQPVADASSSVTMSRSSIPLPFSSGATPSSLPSCRRIKDRGRRAQMCPQPPSRGSTPLRGWATALIQVYTGDRVYTT